MGGGELHLWQAAGAVSPRVGCLTREAQRHGHLVLPDTVRELLLGVSAATADRILRPLREGTSSRGGAHTASASLLRHRVPVRTSSDWEDVEPGFAEVDCVVHGGGRTEGPFLRSLTVTDVATGWTECIALSNGGQDAALAGIEAARRLLPFPLLGIDTDNGPEFITQTLIDFCAQAGLKFTRGRPHRKNDQCFVEQKNGAIVREYVGYDRYEGTVSCRQLMELYHALRLYVNFFQPSMKLVKKRRVGSQVHRTYDQAKTPYQRVIASGVLPEQRQISMDRTFEALDPVRLRGQIKRLQDALWARAVTPSASEGGDGLAGTMDSIARFRAASCMPQVGEEMQTPDDAGDVAGARRRRYRRATKSMGPRTYRTRKDPLERDRDELHQMFLEMPDVTGKALLKQIQDRHPDDYPDNLLRTLQRRVREWRASIILAVDTPGTGDDGLILTSSDGTVHPVTLRASVIADEATDSPCEDEAVGARRNDAGSDGESQS